MRLAILNSPAGGELYGLLLTLTAGHPDFQSPHPSHWCVANPSTCSGRFTGDDAAYARYRAILAQARKVVHLHDIPA